MTSDKTMSLGKKAYFTMTISIDEEEEEGDTKKIINESKKCNREHEITYRHPPFFIVFISIFELVVFAYYALRSDEPISLIGPVPFKSTLIYNPHRRYEIWRHFSYMLIHAGYWHIIVNVLIQLAIGVPLEILHKFNPIFIIYFGGIFGGALGNSIADPHSYLAGASSGCYALIAAHWSNLIINWSEIAERKSQLITLVIFSATDLGTAVYERHFKGDTAYRVSYGGHLAGALSGLLLGLVFLRNVRIQYWEQMVRRAAIVTYISLIVLAIAFNLFYPDYFALPDTNEIGSWTVYPFIQGRE